MNLRKPGPDPSDEKAQLSMRDVGAFILALWSYLLPIFLVVALVFALIAAAVWWLSF